MVWKFAVPMAVMLLVSNLLAQSADVADTNKSSTKIGQFMSVNSVLTERQEFKLGKIGGNGKVDIYAIKTYHPGQGDTLRGFKFEVTESGQGHSRVALLDIEEVRDLIEALKYLAKVSSNRENNAGNDFARIASFTSRDNLTVGYHPVGLYPLDPDGFCSAGRFDISTMYMTEENFEKMIGMVSDGLRILGIK